LLLTDDGGVVVSDGGHGNFDDTVFNTLDFLNGYRGRDGFFPLAHELDGEFTLLQEERFFSFF
jgi:hypothetical protein